MVVVFLKMFLHVLCMSVTLFVYVTFFVMKMILFFFFFKDDVPLADPVDASCRKMCFSPSCKNTNKSINSLFQSGIVTNLMSLHIGVTL